MDIPHDTLLDLLVAPPNRRRFFRLRIRDNRFSPRKLTERLRGSVPRSNPVRTTFRAAAADAAGLPRALTGLGRQGLRSAGKTEVLGLSASALVLLAAVLA